MNPLTTLDSIKKIIYCIGYHPGFTTFVQKLLKDVLVITTDGSRCALYDVQTIDQEPLEQLYLYSKVKQLKERLDDLEEDGLLPKDAFDMYHINGRFLDNLGDPVYCRHLTQTLLMERANENLCSDMPRGFDDAKHKHPYLLQKTKGSTDSRKIPDYFPQEALAEAWSDYPNLRNCMTGIFFLSYKNFGENLEEATQHMLVGDTLLGELTNDCHSMALIITKKSNGYHVSFHDPNETNQSTKVVLTDIKNLQIEDLLTESAYRAYIKPDSTTIVLRCFDQKKLRKFYNSKGKEPTKPLSQIAHNLKSFLLKFSKSVFKEQMLFEVFCYIMLLGSKSQGLLPDPLKPNFLQLIMQDLVGSQLTSDHLKQIFTLPTKEGVETFINFLVNNHDSVSLQTFVRGLGNLKLSGKLYSSDIHAIFLHDQTKKAFYDALEKKSPELLISFVEGFLLIDDLDILSYVTQGNFSSFYHKECIYLFTEQLIQACQQQLITSGKITEIFSWQPNNQFNAIENAIQQNDFSTIYQYVQNLKMLQASQVLSPEQVQQIIQSATSRLPIGVRNESGIETFQNACSMLEATSSENLESMIAYLS